MRSIRSGKGLGDSLYLQSVVRYFVAKGERLRVHSEWPDVFRPLGDAVEVVPFSRDGIRTLAHYTMRKGVTGTTQFQDCCRSAGITEPVELKLDWPQPDTHLTRGLLAHGLPIVLVQLPRAPMGRIDGFGQELLPDCRAIQRAIDRLKGRALLVQVGAGTPLFRFKGLDFDMANSTTIEQLLDLGAISSGVVGYVSFLLPMAESLGKRALLIWSRRGLTSQTPFIRQITPEKVIHRKDLASVVFDALDDDVEGQADAFLR